MGYLSSRGVGAYPLGTRRGASSALYAISTTGFDFAVGGVPFLSGIKKEGRTYRRGFLPVKKDQIDTSGEPGEQGLQEWWYRSQSSWHLGTDLKFLEPAQDKNNAFRFQDSRGIDPWTLGQLSLLRNTESKQAVTSLDIPFIAPAKTGASDLDAILVAHGTTLRLISDAANTTITAGNGANQIVGMATDGHNYYVRAATSIYMGALPSGAGAALWTGLAAVSNPNSGRHPIAYAKQRLIACDGPSIYELIGTAGGAVPAAKFTHPVSTWRWTAIAEGPNAIYVAGNDGTIEQGTPRHTGVVSAVYKIQANSDGTLGTPTAVFTAPYGEFVGSVLVHNGLVFIGTNKGLRAGKVDAQTTGNSGDFLLEGPILDIPRNTAIRALGARDRFVYAAFANETTAEIGLVRVDTTQQLTSGAYAWAYDLQATATPGIGDAVVGIAPFGQSDRMAFVIQGVSGAGSVILEKATEKVVSGYLKTGNIRFNTLEKKIFRYLNLRFARALEGALAVSYITPDGTETTVSSFAEGSGEPTDLLLPETPIQYAAFKFTLSRGVTVSTGASMVGWQLKALPWTNRTTVIQVPLMCYDHERDGNSRAVGYKGFALERLELLESLVSTGQPVSFQDFTTNRSYTVIVDDYRFEQQEAPEKVSGFGGLVDLQLRIVI